MKHTPISRQLFDRMMVCAEAYGVLKQLREDNELPEYVNGLVDRLIAQHDALKKETV